MGNARKFDFDKKLKKNRIIILSLSLLFDVAFYIYLTVTNNFSFNSIVVLIELVIFTAFSVCILSVFTVSRGKGQMWFILTTSLFPISFALYILEAQNDFESFLVESAVILTLFILYAIMIRYNLKQNNRWNGVKDIRFIKEFVRLVIIGFSVIILMSNIITDIGIQIYEHNKETVFYQYEIEMSPKVKATNEAKTKNNSFARYYIEELSPLVIDNWEQVTQQDKLNIAQIIINIYATYYGLSDEISVVLVDIEDGEDTVLLGAYDHYQKMILLNSRYFSVTSKEDWLNVLLHEFYHAYQHDQAEIINYLPEEKQNLGILAEAKYYKEGFENYIDGEADFESYQSQYVETTARDFADIEAESLLRIIFNNLYDVKSK